MSTRRVTTSPGPPDRAPLVATNPPWHARRVPRIVLDFDPEQPEAPSFQTETSELVFFLSWAFSQRYGANHEMSQAALILRSEYKIDMTPLLTFADREVEDPDDADVLERSWQDAAPLAECCRSAPPPCRRRVTPPGICRCCSRGAAACSSSATPRPTGDVSASVRSTRTSTRGGGWRLWLSSTRAGSV